MTRKSNRSIFYTASRIFWSIYFVMTISLIGLVMGYIVTMSLYFLARFCSKVPVISKSIERAAEQIQCHSIHFLLQIQPWLIWKHNFHSVKDFYSVYDTRRILFVSNHRSNLDTFFLIGLIPGLRGLAKSSLFSNIFFAPMMWAIGFVPVRKGSVADFIQGLRDLRTKILDRDRPVLIFPETTRCEKDFASIQKFSAAVFDVALGSDAIIVPIFIAGSDAVMGRGEFLLNPYQPVDLKLLKPIRSSEYKSAGDLSQTVWNLLRSEQLAALCN